MKKKIFIFNFCLLFINLNAQNQKFITFDKNIDEFEYNWTGNILFGNNFFLGDLYKKSSQKYLSNVSLSIEFNKQISSNNSIQFSISSGKNSGQNNYHENNDIDFRSSFSKTDLSFRKLLNQNKVEKFLIHFLTGFGYFNGNGYNQNNEYEIWSTYFPVGIEISFFNKNDWGLIFDVTNCFFLRDNIDNYIDESNGNDAQLSINLGICYKLR